MRFQSFSKRQLLALSWWNRPGLMDRDGILCHGAVRSGKSVCCAVGFFLWSMSCFRGQVFGICGKTIGALRRNILQNLPGWLGPMLKIKESRSENKLTVTAPWGAKNVYYLFGGQDEGSADLIQGITLAGVLLDEAALMPRSFVEQACARCSVGGAKLWMCCNPQGPEHWFYREWVCKAKDKNLLQLHFTMQDNPALDPAVRQRYERLYTGVFYRRFVLGQWCRAEGLVYEFSRRNVAKNLPHHGKFYISVDYGTMNPFSAGLWCVTGEKAYRIREFYYCGRETGQLMTDEDYYGALERLAGELPIQRVIVDPSAASFIALIRKRGRFAVRKARNEVIPGIRLVASCLAGERLFIGENCTDCIREFSLYRWQDGTDVPRKEDDHAMDDVRYFCTAVMRR
ncbi:MAG: PBSX family phage terminase large subunit [Oscillospiraceae bacterium]|nr:PBSX family phage terminase large subunit [Oscillospiraceae bacterium]